MAKNTFMKAAEKQAEEMESAQKGKEKEESPKFKSRNKKVPDGLQVVTVRVPSEIHRAAQYHRIETGENMTQLICRLLAKEFEDKL